MDSVGACTGPKVPAAASITDMSSSIADVLAGTPKAVTTRGCNSPACPASHSWPCAFWTKIAAQRPGCQGSCWSARISNGTRLVRAITLAASIASCQPPACPRPSQPAGSAFPARTAPTRSGWSGSAASSSATSCTAGPRSTRRIGAVGAASLRGRKTRPNSYSCDVGEAAPKVAGQRPQQAGQQRRPHQRLVVTERVRHADRAAAGIVGRQLEPVEVRCRCERPAQHLH